METNSTEDAQPAEMESIATEQDETEYEDYDEFDDCDPGSGEDPFDTLPKMDLIISIECVI